MNGNLVGKIRQTIVTKSIITGSLESRPALASRQSNVGHFTKSDSSGVRLDVDRTKSKILDALSRILLLFHNRKPSHVRHYNNAL